MLAPQPIAGTAVREQEGCGERGTETGDVLTPGPGGVRGCGGGGEDADGGCHAEALAQGLNLPAPAVPGVRAGEGGVATGREEGRRGFQRVPGAWRRPLSSAASSLLPAADPG